jgi:hypothetical protein
MMIHERVKVGTAIFGQHRPRPFVQKPVNHNPVVSRQLSELDRGHLAKSFECRGLVKGPRGGFQRSQKFCR